MGKLSTHVLDTTVGKPASNLEIALYYKDDGEFKLLKTIKTNNDGRCDQPLLENEYLIKGAYELVFEVADYFTTQNVESRFLQDVVIRFHINDATQNYHVPLLITPFSYSTYRGS